MVRCPFATAVVFTLVFGTPALAAQHVLDVSSSQGVVTLTVAAGQPLTVNIVNLAPAAAYDISVLVEIIPVPELDPKVLRTEARVQECSALTVAKELATQTDELAVATRVRRIEDERKNCADPEQREIDLRLGATRRTITVATLRQGEQVRVVVVRKTQPTKTWSLLLTTGARGNWRALYGMAFGPGDEDKFFAKPGAEASTFIITPEREDANKRSDLAAIPAAFFQWLPLSRELRDWAVGPTLGLGVKSDRPAFFLGGILTYNQNLGLVAGVPVYQEWKLRGSFSEGQAIGENLTEEQLHKRVFRFQRFFVAGVYRFGSNPFGGGEDKTKDPDPKDPKR